MVFVDSSVWIDYFCGRETPATNLLDDFLGKKPLIIGELVMAEVLQGFRSDKDYLAAKRLLNSLDFRVMGDKALAVQAAENYRFLRKQGVTVRKTIDVLIATFCLEHDLPLLQADKDFLPFAEHFDLAVLPEQ